MLFCIVSILIYIPTNSVQAFSFLHILADTCYLLFLFCLIISVLTDNEVIAQCGFGTL